ncbi:MAG: efflux RND transporter periplasmic adaptor subunit, partial [Catalinimonas sp.]
ARLVQARAAYKRNKDLFDQKVISDAEWEQAQAEFEVAEKEAAAAGENVRAAQFNVQSARATVDEAQENLRRTALFAPVDGTVSKLDVELGERVVGTLQMAGTELLRIADLTQMEVRVDVNENDIIRVQVGDTADIEVDSYAYRDKQFKGVVTAIANTANATLTPDAVTEFEVRVRILNDSYQDLTSGMEKRASPFRPGMTASVDIVTERKQGVMAVPLAAVTTRVPGEKKRDDEDDDEEKQAKRTTNADPIEVVFVVDEEGKVERRPVKIGISDFEYIEILSGLSGDETVVSGPFRAVSQKLDDGDAVNVKEEEDDDREPRAMRD